jgi:hypothetical protein
MRSIRPVGGLGGADVYPLATVYGQGLPAGGHERRPSFPPIDNW